MRNACETMCCLRELLFLNLFVKANKAKSSDWDFFLFGLVLHRHLWWAEPVLGARAALGLPRGLSIPMLGCGTQLWMPKPFWDVQWNCSSPTLRGAPLPCRESKTQEWQNGSCRQVIQSLLTSQLWWGHDSEKDQLFGGLIAVLQWMVNCTEYYHKRFLTSNSLPQS